jgi:predicted SPOUT superfamily RNA methylase MTH1
MVGSRSYRLKIAIPSSFTVESADPKLRAYKIGQVARAAAVFRVDEVVVYRDREHDGSREILALLQYAETPQYLRKHLFKSAPELRYAGVLPPLRLPSHRVQPSLAEGQYREGVVLRHNRMTEDGSDAAAWVDVGATSPVPAAESLPAGKRTTVRIYSRDGKFWCTPDRSPEYRGYAVRYYPTLSGLMDRQSQVIVTSVEGERISCNLLQRLRPMLSGDVMVIFGSPHRGVGPILGDEGRSFSEFQCIIANVVPDQGSVTVRTEEAVFAALALINIIE